MKTTRMIASAALALLVTSGSYGCAQEETESEVEQTEDDLSVTELARSLLYTGRVDHAGIVESGTMLLRGFGEMDVYNRQDPFNIAPGPHAVTLRENFLSYDAIDQRMDWTADNVARWVVRMSTGNYLVVDTSKPCTFGKASYLDIEREQMFGTPHTTCGGRTPPEDALDVTYNFLIRGRPEKAADIGDGVDSLHKPAMTTFPYLAAADD